MRSREKERQERREEKKISSLPFFFFPPQFHFCSSTLFRPPSLSSFPSVHNSLPPPSSPHLFLCSWIRRGFLPPLSNLSTNVPRSLSPLFFAPWQAVCVIFSPFPLLPPSARPEARKEKLFRFLLPSSPAVSFPPTRSKEKEKGKSGQGSMTPKTGSWEERF